MQPVEREMSREHIARPDLPHPVGYVGWDVGSGIPVEDDRSQRPAFEHNGLSTIELKYGGGKIDRPESLLAGLGDSLLLVKDYHELTGVGPIVPEQPRSDCSLWI